MAKIKLEPSSFQRIKLGKFILEGRMADIALKNHGITCATSKALAASSIIAQSFQQLSPHLMETKQTAANKGLNLEQIVHKFNKVLPVTVADLRRTMAEAEKKPKSEDHLSTIMHYLEGKLNETPEGYWIEITTGDLALHKMNNDQILEAIKDKRPDASTALAGLVSIASLAYAASQDFRGTGLGALSLLLLTVPWLIHKALNFADNMALAKEFEKHIHKEQLEIVRHEVALTKAEFTRLCGLEKDDLDKHSLEKGIRGDPRLDLIDNIARRIAEIKEVLPLEKKKLIEILQYVHAEPRLDNFYKIAEFYTTIEDHMKKLIPDRRELHQLFVDAGLVSKN